MLRQSRAHLFAFAIYSLLTVIFTWPILSYFTSHILGSYATDSLEYLWKIWWVPEALFRRGISPLFAPQLYYPFGYELSWGELTPLHTFLMMPLTLWLGEQFTYNLAILLSYLLTAMFTYALARCWLRATVSDQSLLFLTSLFAGAVFAFCVYRIQHVAGGHLNLVHTEWMILALFAFDRWLEARHLRDALLLGLAVSLAALSTWYYAIMLIFLFPVYVLGRGQLLALLRDRRTWLGVLSAGLLVALLCGPFLLPYLKAAAGGETAVPLSQAIFWAASPLDYLMPNPSHPLWGAVVQRLMWPVAGVEMPIEFMISVGWITPILAFYGWRQTSKMGAHWRALKWLIIAAFVLSLGPYLNLGRLSTSIPLPVLLLREVVPIADSIRSWGRFALFVMFGLTLLAAAALGRLLQPPSTRWLIPLLFVVILFATWDGPAGLVEPKAQPVDEWLAAQPGEFAVMQYPIDIALAGGAMFATRYHDHPATYAMGTFFNFLYRQRHPDLYTFPADAALDQLHAWDVRYILVKLDALTFPLADIDTQPRLRHVITLDDQAVYELLR